MTKDFEFDQTNEDRFDLCCIEDGDVEVGALEHLTRADIIALRIVIDQFLAEPKN